MATATVTLYKTPSLRQRLVFGGVLIGCTDTSFAMAANAQACGGLAITETIVRSLSGEQNPDPASPGLNQSQLVRVARALHVAYTNASGDDWASLVSRIDAGRRIVAQLWYADIGGSNIGHAIFIESRRTYRGVAQVGGVDPIKGRRAWYRASDVRHAMEHFGSMGGLPAGGLYYGYTRPVQLVAVR